MRSRSLASILRTMPPGGHLLELGAGSGVEAVAVARERHATIVAVEPAQALASLITQRASGLPIQVRVATASQALESIQAEKEVFEGAWSSFALGYDDPLDRLRPLLAAALRPGAPFTVSLRNPWCLAAPWSAPARVRGTYRHKVGEARVSLRHYSRRTAERSLSPSFELVRWEALPVLVPPPNAGSIWNKLGAVARACERLDARVAGLSPFHSLGDHTLFEFRRR